MQPLIPEDIPKSASGKRPRLLVFIVAYQAETTIESVLTRIPQSLADEYETEILVIDDASSDRTFSVGREFAQKKPLPFRLTVLFNPINQGYGGNQKIGYHYARRNHFDFVALLHGDGQYAPESLPDLVKPLRDKLADACFGSRMVQPGSARKGGMPLYKFIGNKLLSWFENKILRSQFSEFHSGYRVYSVEALNKVPFDLNTNDFHFDTEIIIQFLIAGLRIVERPIPTHYGDEICRVNGLKYALDVARAAIRARAQEFGIFYDRRFDCAPTRDFRRDKVRLEFPSAQSYAVSIVEPKSRVLDLGCGFGHVAEALKNDKACYVVGVDLLTPPVRSRLDQFHQHDLNTGLPQVNMGKIDTILMLDLIEHLLDPERFIGELRAAVALSPDVRIIVSVANVAFLTTRLMLLFGQFNYGKRGILDLTHTRLFTFGSIRRLFEQCGFLVLETRGIPAPLALVANSRLSRGLMRLNQLLISVSKRMFAYEIVAVVRPCASLESLLVDAWKRPSAPYIKELPSEEGVFVDATEER